MRVPPIRTAQRENAALPKSGAPIKFDVLFEDAALLVINKPSGLAVHGGSGISLGAIEQLRATRPEAKFLELVHRLDRDTLRGADVRKKAIGAGGDARKIAGGKVQKLYLALVRGHWRDAKRAVKVPLQKHLLANGERRVSVSEDGQAAHTIFRLRQSWPKLETPVQSARS